MLQGSVRATTSVIMLNLTMSASKPKTMTTHGLLDELTIVCNLIWNMIDKGRTKNVNVVVFGPADFT